MGTRTGTIQAIFVVCFFMIGLLGCSNVERAGEARSASNRDSGPFIVVNPYAGVDWDTFEHHRAALHLHTLQSDGGNSVKEVVMAYREAGFTILSITDHDWNRPNPATPYPAEPRPHNFPANPTWPWTDYGCPSPEELGMVGIQGSELTFRHHINSYFSDYGVWYNRTGDEAPYGGIVDEQGNEIWEDDQLLAIQVKNGLAILNHPGVLHEHPWWVRRPLDWYVERFERHSHNYLVGMEVTNCPTDREEYDEGLWDQLLARFMPHRPIWGFGTDDMHRLTEARESDSVFVLAEHSEQAVRRAMEAGQFYFRKSTRRNDVREREPAEQLFPRIDAIRVDLQAGTITVQAANYDAIKWISAPESLEPVADYKTSHSPWPLGRVVHEGETLDYRSTPNLKNYVRVEVYRIDGEDTFRTFTNPFGLASSK